MTRGCKVIVNGREDAGFGEITAVSSDASIVQIRYYKNSVSSVSVTAPMEHVHEAPLPGQSRCFQIADGMTRYGRVIARLDDPGPLATYQIQFAGEGKLTSVREDEFFVRSYLPADAPLDVLTSLANETPFFFEPRMSFLRELLRQTRLAHGLPALLSSKIDILPHQVHIVDQVLRDPTIRYLLADEVGLGKTVETGIILRQLLLDAPETRMAVFVPDQLVRQWTEELQRRFDLHGVNVRPHSALADEATVAQRLDIAVIDEAHRVAWGGTGKRTKIMAGAAAVASRSRHLLLLSATPILHHDQELLALLGLLDPDNYSRVTLEAFQARTAQRGELGRSFLALQRAQAIPLIRLNARKLAAILPADVVVREIAERITDAGADILALRRELHLHISETYRIHRRLLRTRRRWLAETNPQFARATAIEERTQFELDEEPHVQLWRALDEWRTEIAARVANSPSVFAQAADEYILLAETIAAEPDLLGDLVEEVATRTNATEAEVELLDRLSDPRAAKEMTRARAELVAEVLRRRGARSTTNEKVVVFCPTTDICREVAAVFKRRGEHKSICVADASLTREKAGDVLSGFATDGANILLTDRTGEEGFNLQFARILVLYDLPWSPMRIEQRLGRLDRLERAGKITCYDVVTGEDDELCLDEAWRRVLAEGFGVFKQSISDLQHMVETELPSLRKCAFRGGPSALINEIPGLAARVADERAQIEEQDVVDGMQNVPAESVLCRDLRMADEDAENFGKAFASYLCNNVGLQQRSHDEDNAFYFTLPKFKEGLIPADRLRLIAQKLKQPSTVHRDVAIEGNGVQLLRPGHSAVNACGELLAWDDRGRAFASWRATPELVHPQPIFRCLARVWVDLRPVDEALRKTVWEPLQRGGLLRLVRGWFPEFLTELFVDQAGQAAATGLIEHCRKPYTRNADKNLGEELADSLRKAFGESTWREWCGTAAEAVLRRVCEGEELRTQREAALVEAETHFLAVRLRLDARLRSGTDGTIQIEKELADAQMVGALVKEILLHPTVELDTIGAYVLSAEPFWDAP